MCLSQYTINNTEVVTQNGQSRETDKQAKNEHNVRWTPLSASKHK